MNMNPAMTSLTLTNRLSALGVALGDRQANAVTRATGLSASRAAAIVSIGADPGISATRLAPVIGVTQSVAARLSDDLIRSGHVAKAPGGSAREMSLRLTPAGEGLRAQILRVRLAEAEAILAGLSAADQARLAPLVDALLAALTPDVRTADHICRLCDEDACGLDDCPVERRARALG